MIIDADANFWSIDGNGKATKNGTVDERTWEDSRFEHRKQGVYGCDKDGKWWSWNSEKWKKEEKDWWKSLTEPKSVFLYCPGNDVDASSRIILNNVI